METSEVLIIPHIDFHETNRIDSNIDTPQKQ